MMLLQLLTDPNHMPLLQYQETDFGGRYNQ